MSAWLVSENHINAIISFALDHGVDLPKGASPAKTCRILTNENVRSLSARYGGRDFLDEWKRHAKKYRFEKIDDIGELTARLAKGRSRNLGLAVPTMDEMAVAVQIIKCCDCYDYQSCETDKYGNTRSAKFITRVRHKAEQLAPGKHDKLYADLLWGLD
jgi:hypothetical protein